MELKQVFSKIKETVNYESTIGRAAGAVRHSVRVVGDKSKAVAQYLPHKNKKNIYEEKMHPSKHYHTLRECLNDVCTLYGNVVAYRTCTEKREKTVSLTVHCMIPFVN